MLPPNNKFITDDKDASNRRLPFSKEFEQISRNLYFILVEPESPGNLGACARAIKTCGFSNLILVNPKIDQSIPQAFWMAHQSEDILNNAQTFNTMEEAIADKSLVVATTQRKRHFKFPFYTPEEVSEKIQEVAVTNPVAIVFGRERTGLTNEEITRCHIHSTIFTATKKPSLNLAQSVMIYAHTFFRLQNVRHAHYHYDLASQEEIEFFYEHLYKSLDKVGFVPRDSMDNFMTRFKRLIGRSMAEKRDIRLLHKLLQIFERRISELEKELKQTEGSTSTSSVTDPTGSTSAGSTSTGSVTGEADVSTKNQTQCKQRGTKFFL